MGNLSNTKCFEYVKNVRLEQVERDIKSYKIAARLSFVFLILFLLVLHLIAIATARNLDYSLRFSLIAGLIPVVGPVFLTVKLIILKSFSAIILLLTTIPCVVMLLYGAIARKKRAFLHNAICMIAEKSLVPIDLFEPRLSNFSDINGESTHNDSNKILSKTQELVLKNIVIEEDGIESGLPVAPNSEPETSEFQPDSIKPPSGSLFITSSEAVKDAVHGTNNGTKDDVDRIIDEILGRQNQ